MCTNPLHIFNKSTGQELFVPCGHCPSCLVQKASNRCAKIMNDYDSSFNYFFVTLTYSNDYVPYVLLNDVINSVSKIPVYRGTFAEEVLDLSSDLGSSKVYIPKRAELRNFPFYNCIGVLRWNDLVKFQKRLRKYINKNYARPFISYYQVSEYGETFFRPHFHILYKTNLTESQLYSAVCACWSMCDWNTVPRAIEKALNPASYLSFYLTSSFHLPLFYKTSEFKQKFSHSHNFGLVSDKFSFLSVLVAAENHTLTYDVPSVSSFGTSLRSSIPYPKYIISRYFPKIKGFSRLSFDEFYTLCHSLSRPSERVSISFRTPSLQQPIKNKLLNYDTVCISSVALATVLYKLRYSAEDIRRTVHAINRVYAYCKYYNVNFDYFLHVWYNIPLISFSEAFKSSFQYISKESDFMNFYFNYRDYLFGNVRAPTLDRIFDNSSLDELGFLSKFDKNKHLISVFKLQKFNKNSKIKTHLL